MFRALGAGRGWTLISVRCQISMRWVPAERSSKAKKSFLRESARPSPNSNKRALPNKRAMGALQRRKPISVIARQLKNASY